MKVVHIISSFGAGGAELLVKDIALNSDKNLQVEIWAIGKGEDKIFEEKYKNELSKNRIGFAEINKSPGAGKFKAIKTIRFLIRRRRPDVINTHSELSTFYTAFAAVGLKIKLIQTIHNTVITYPIIQRFFAKPFIDSYVAISEGCRQLIKKVIKPTDKKIELIYNGINLNKFQKQQRVIKPAVKSIIAIGRLDFQKDHMTMIKAFLHVLEFAGKEKLPLPQLNIVGTGKLKNKLIELVKDLNINGYVNFLGARNDIPELLYQNDMWVMSSRWEGLSIALLEALASGIPVVATDVGSNCEVIDQNINGKLVPKEEEYILAEGIFTVMKDFKLREQLSKNAIVKAEKFNIINCTEQYTELYKKLVPFKPAGTHKRILMTTG